MRKVSVRELSRKPAATLGQIAAGETVVVTSHDRPIAMLSEVPDDIALRELPLADPRVQRILAQRASGPGGPADDVLTPLWSALDRAEERVRRVRPTRRALASKVSRLASVTERQAAAIVDAIVDELAGRRLRPARRTRRGPAASGPRMPAEGRRPRNAEECCGRRRGLWA